MPTDDPLRDAVMSPDIVEIDDARLNVIRRLRLRSAAAALLEADDLSQVIDHRGYWLEVITASRSAVTLHDRRSLSRALLIT